MARTSVEIHCPNCGTLLRVVMHETACPDCDNKQAIFLPYGAYMRDIMLQEKSDQLMKLQGGDTDGY
jgi:Zn finger protein HypA/HybF involved in hydrogenase expression